MYIVAIAWIYVVGAMAFTETSLVAGVLTFVCYGLAPLALLLWLVGTPQRKRNKLREITREAAREPDGTDAERDE
ncbi:MAG: hypothetical protein ACREUV_00040 [Burkholderiales bacterium]